MQSPVAATDARDWVALVREPLPVDAMLTWATRPSCGAVVSFLGVVRDNADGHDGVHSMTYEAYEEHATRTMRDVVAEARRRHPDIECVALVHRVGELRLSEASVAVVVSSPHRDAAFDAARYCIDTVKQTAPIWKQEHSDGGSAWVPGAPITRVEAAAAVPARSD